MCSSIRIFRANNFFPHTSIISREKKKLSIFSYYDAPLIFFLEDIVRMIRTYIRYAVVIFIILISFCYAKIHNFLQCFSDHFLLLMMFLVYSSRQLSASSLVSCHIRSISSILHRILCTEVGFIITTYSDGSRIAIQRKRNVLKITQGQSFLSLLSMHARAPMHFPRMQATSFQPPKKGTSSH